MRWAHSSILRLKTRMTVGLVVTVHGIAESGIQQSLALFLMSTYVTFAFSFLFFFLVLWKSRKSFLFASIIKTGWVGLTWRHSLLIPIRHRFYVPCICYLLDTPENFQYWFLCLIFINIITLPQVTLGRLPIKTRPSWVNLFGFHFIKEIEYA